MREVLDLTVIIPIHEINDDLKKLLRNAVESVVKQVFPPAKMLFVIKPDKEIIEFIQNLNIKEIPYNVIENTGATDFQSQLNLGVENVQTEWFSYLEMDDEYSKIWFKNVNEYIKAYENIDVFLPIIVDVDTNGQFLGFINEPVWAHGFADDLGYLTHDALLTYQNFSFSGMVMRKSAYQEHGGLKPSIKLTFMYEFLLRVTHYGSEVMVIPKLGYKHITERPGALFTEYHKTIDPVEAKWWLSLAKRECHQLKDRGITYETSQE